MEKKVTLIRSYSPTAQFLASSVAFRVSFNSSILRILDLSPPNILDEAASSFSILVCREDNSEKRVCTVSKALVRSENALFTANTTPRYSWSVSCNICQIKITKISTYFQRMVKQSFNTNSEQVMKVPKHDKVGNLSP